jgi:nicotinamidase-related amidase
VHDVTDGNPIPVADLALDFPDTVRRSKFKGLRFAHTSFKTNISFDEAFKAVVADKKQWNATRPHEPVSAMLSKAACSGPMTMSKLPSRQGERNMDFVKAGLNALLTPEESVLLLIDHQAFQFANLNSHDPTIIVNNIIALAKVAKVFGVPVILTTVTEERGGHIIKGLQDVFPEEKPIDRTFINTWQDERVVTAIKKTGRKKIVMASLWTEMCLAMPAIQAQGEGYQVYAVTDASGGVSPEAHDMAVRRMVQAGVVPITWMALRATAEITTHNLSFLCHNQPSPRADFAEDQGGSGCHDQGHFALFGEAWRRTRGFVIVPIRRYGSVGTITLCGPSPSTRMCCARCCCATRAPLWTN